VRIEIASPVDLEPLADLLNDWDGLAEGF